METTLETAQQETTIPCCTQDMDSPPTTLAVSVSETLQLFAHFPDDAKAKLLLASAKVEKKDNHETHLSPQRILFHSQLKYVDEMEKHLPRNLYGNELGELVAKQYIKVSNKTTATSIHQRTLSVNNEQNKNNITLPYNSRNTIHSKSMTLSLPPGTKKSSSKSIY